MARATGVVVDSGHAGTVVSVLHDGYTLNKCTFFLSIWWLLLTLLAIIYSPMGGEFLTNLLRTTVKDKPEPRPRYLFTRKKKKNTWDITSIARPNATKSVLIRN